MTHGTGPLVPEDIAQATEAFAQHPRVLVASDFDGVLAPIVLDPSTSAPMQGTVEALRRLSALPGVTAAIASGRDLVTLRALTGLTDDDGVVLIGSHGAESTAPTATGAAPSGDLTDAERAALSRAEAAVEAVIAEVPEARIEHKPAGVVLHTRGLSEPDAERAASLLLDAVADLRGVRAMRGKSVVELSVLDASKGASLEALATTVGADATAYFGDDVTDETVFRVLSAPARDLTVKVGDGETAAAFRVDDCAAVPPLLDLLVTKLESSRPKVSLI